MPRLLPIGGYRLKKARELFLASIYSVVSMREYYRVWRDDVNFMCGEKWTFPLKGGKRTIINERVSWKLPKRGDSLYKYYLKEKLEWINKLPTESLFNPRDRSKTVQHTNFLFVTWTTKKYDRRYTNREQHDIWKEDSSMINRCMTRLRQHYGRIEYLRSNEGTKAGFPAPHGILLFLDYTWNISLFKGRDGRRKWRVFGAQYQELKSVLDGHDSRASPVLGFSDIQGIFNPRMALRHITKYCFATELDYPEYQRVRKMEIQELTYFWLWITRKHTYSQSRHFIINCQIILKVNSDLTRRQLGISKVVWVYLEVTTPEEAEKWDRGPEEIPWVGPGSPGGGP